MLCSIMTSYIHVIFVIVNIYLTEELTKKIRI